MRSIKAVKQDQADTERALAALRTEGRGLMAVTARTPEQEARLTAIEGEMDTLTAKAETLATEHARALKFMDEERAEATLPHVQVGHDRATDRPWGPPIPASASAKTRQQMLETEFGAYMQAVYKAGTTGEIDPRLMAAAGASTSVTSDAGFLVRTEWNTMLLERAMEAAVLAPYCFPVPVGENADGVELPYLSETSRATGSRWGGVRVYRAKEAATVTNSHPGTGETLEIRLTDLMGLMYTTDRQMRDAASYGRLAANAFGSEFAFVLDDEIVRGDGVGQCKGLLNSLTSSTPAGPVISVSKDTGQTAATFTNTNISNMWVRMHPRRKANSVWFINHELGPQLDMLSIPAGTSALEPRFVTYGPDGILRIKGRPVVELEQCAALGTVGDVILADMSDYLLITKGGLEQATSDHVRFIYKERTFRWSRSINGAPATRSALTPYKGTATLSPYVVLATRA